MQVAAGVLKNTRSDNQRDRVCEFVNLCVGEVVEVAKLDGEWLLLNAAAKEWIRRNHEIEPDTLGDEDASLAVAPSTSYGWTSDWGTGATKKTIPRRPPTLAQLRVTRLSSMEVALQEVDSLLRCPFFMTHNSGIFFELNRCWFLSGACQLVADATITIGTRSVRVPGCTDVASYHHTTRIEDKINTDGHHFT